MAPAVIESVVADLEKALREDGIESPRIVATAVNPASGPPIGVSDLVDALEEAVNDDRVFEKLLVDLAQGSARLLDATGGTGLEFETRARAVLETTACMVVDGQTRSAIDELTLFLEAIANEAGGSTGSRVRQIAALVPSHVESVADGVKTSTPIENRRRFRARRSDLEASRAEQRDAAGEILDDLVIDPTRGALAARAQANAALADLSLSVEKARAVTTR
ncbi:MAG: hypothetical protein ACE1Z0_07085 [Acidimicrobiia bacterium]